ncbi:hypothetical protein, partial [Alistipes sp.]|uniref:hypothetical protein n=1 Tax=Alistipes sp. TaxID=1872444 RepID=UPI0028734C62
ERQQIYSLPHLATLVSARFIRTVSKNRRRFPSPAGTKVKTIFEFCNDHTLFIELLYVFYRFAARFAASINLAISHLGT